MAKKHEYSHTTVHHHKDGSHTMKHHHENDSAKDMEYAVPDHDSMMDGMQQNIGGEGAAEPAPGAAGGAPAPTAGV